VIVLLRCSKCKKRWLKVEVIHPMDIENIKDKMICNYCKKREKKFLRKLKSILSKTNIDENEKKLVLEKYSEFLHKTIL